MSAVQRGGELAGRASRIGFVGLGRMGLPMCRRLAAAGFAVSAFDLRESELRAAVEEMGVRWAASVAGAAVGAEILVTVLPGPCEVLAVADEVACELGRGAVWLDMSTASPPVAEAVAKRGLAAVDAPVGGGPAAAGTGTLLAFAGGSALHLERCRVVLSALCERVLHVGGHGSGYAVKLLVNALWFTQACATAEALALGDHLGLDLELLLDALGRSAAGSRFLDVDVRALVEGDDLPSFSLARCHEELASVMSLAQAHDVPVDTLSAVAALHAGALERFGDLDGELLGARFVCERAGVSLGFRRH